MAKYLIIAELEVFKSE